MRPRRRRGYAGVAVVIAVLLLAACYSAIDVATTDRPDPTPARHRADWHLAGAGRGAVGVAAAAGSAAYDRLQLGLPQRLQH
jgi:hypothetical protein